MKTNNVFLFLAVFAVFIPLILARITFAAATLETTADNGCSVTMDVKSEPNDVVAPGDYDGDGKIDPVVYRESSGEWIGALSGYRYNNFRVILGGSGFLPAPADYDGDEKTDPAVVCPTTGEWRMMPSSANGAVITHVFSDMDNSVPAIADYDGDGKADPALFRKTDGLLCVLLSGKSYELKTCLVGGANTIPMPADYDGDCLADPTSFDPAKGTLYVLRSVAGYKELARTVAQPGSELIAADIDGDKKADLIVRQRTAQTAFILYSGRNYEKAEMKTISADGYLCCGDLDGAGNKELIMFYPHQGTWTSISGNRRKTPATLEVFPKGAAPAVPTNVVASDGAYDGIRVSWSAVSGVTNYEVCISASAGGGGNCIGCTTTNLMDVSQYPGVTNYYSVRSIGSGGETSGFSSADSGWKSAGLATPAITVSQGQPNGIHVSWSAVSGATNYEVWRLSSGGGNNTKISDVADTNYVDVNQRANVTNSYSVRACGTNYYQSYMSLSNSGWKGVALATPTISASDGTYSNKILISWSSVAGATNYEIYRSSSSGGSGNKIADSVNTNYEDTSQEPGDVAYYSVRAFGTNGYESLESSQDSGWQGAALPTPTGIQASDGTYANKVRVNWSSVIGATNYEVWRSWDGGAGNSSGAGNKIGETSSTNFDDTGISLGTTNYYRVKAVGTDGKSLISAADAGYRAAGLATPTGVQASDGTYSDRIRVTWNAIAGATNYEVWRNGGAGNTASSGAGNKIGETPSPTFDDTAMTAGETNYYRVKALGANGAESYFSEPDTGYAGSAGATIRMGYVQFASDNYPVSGNAGSVSLTVTRTGPAESEASVSYATADNTARAREDYTETSGKLMWSAGDMSPQTITVPILNNQAVTDTRSFTVSLSDANGVILNYLIKAIVTISNVNEVLPELSITEASQQSDDLGKVKVRYSLNTRNLGNANVSVAFSQDGGNTYTEPSSSDLSGDLGSNIGSGYHEFLWNARQIYSAKSANTYNANVRARIIAYIGNTTVSTVSIPFAVDFRRRLTVSGKVRDANDDSAIGGARVSLAGQSTTSSGNGSYSLSGVILENGNILAVTKTAYKDYQEGISVSPGSQSITKNVAMQKERPPEVQPEISSVRAKYNGIFLGSLHIYNEYTVTIDWKGGSGGYVEFYANNNLIERKQTSSSQASCSFDLSSYFTPSLKSGANKVRVIAKTASGLNSAPYTVNICMIPLPDATVNLSPNFSVQSKDQEVYLYIDLQVPDPAIKNTIILPVIGTFGAEVSANASFDYTVSDGSWEFALGLGAEDINHYGKRSHRPVKPANRPDKLKLLVGKKEISGSLEAGASGTATSSGGIAFNEAYGRGSISAKFELARFGLPDLLGPGISIWLKALPIVGQYVNAVTIAIVTTPKIDGTMNFYLRPSFKFKNALVSGSLPLEAEYAPCDSLRLYVGGRPTVTFQVPGALIKELNFKAYAGATVNIWLFQGSKEYVFVDKTMLNSLHSLTDDFELFANDIVGLRSAASLNTDLKPMDRSYRQWGAESYPNSADKQICGDAAALQAFRTMCSAPAKSSVPVNQALAGGVHTAVQSALCQADLTIISNAFTYSEPALAAYGNDLMLVYVADNGNTNSLQFTDIKWTRFDGTNWSLPQFITSDTRAEFTPKVAFDGNSNAVAVWNRVADQTFTNSDIEAMAAQMEIVWSYWDRSNGTWSTPEALTANSCLDHLPLLCGPLGNGDLIVAWTRNEANLLTGTGAVGSVANDKVMLSQWHSATRTWSSIETFASNITYRTSQALAGQGGKAIYAWTTDADGDFTNSSDQELFCKIYSSGQLSEALQITTNAFADRNVRAVVNSGGDIYLVWQQESNLVMRVNNDESWLARANAEDQDLADYTLTLGPNGNLVLLWQDMSASGPQMFYRVYDPVVGSWSEDESLFRDSNLERSYAATWDNVGNLTVAYNREQITVTNKTVLLESGNSVDIENVPQSGPVDVCVVKRALITDLALNAGDFTVVGNNYLPGDALTLSSRIRNVGNLAVTNVTVAFYDGNPAQNGTLITNMTVSETLSGGATDTVVSATWVVPEPAMARTLYAVVDPDSVISEITRTNNMRSVTIGNTDIQVSLVSAGAQLNGSVKIQASVRNSGAAPVPASTLSLRSTDDLGLIAANQIEALDGGMSVQTVFDLPAGTQVSDEMIYTLIADEAGVTGDAYTNNNFVTFSVNKRMTARPYVKNDFDGDGRTDPAVFNSGTWRIWASSMNYMETCVESWGSAGDTPVVADYDGDGRADPCVFNSGMWRVWASSASYTEICVNGLGGIGDTPITADYDNDGRTDPSVYQASTGTWRIWLSGNDYQEASVSGIGGSDWRPVPADYNDDGYSDLAIYNAMSGTWRVWMSPTYKEVSVAGLGGVGFDPVPADFDGDGKADPAVYQAATGTWRIWFSSLSYEEVSVNGWGGLGFNPVCGDYDGDGKIDPVVYKSVTGTWRLWFSCSAYAGFSISGLGGPNTMPVNP